MTKFGGLRVAWLEAFVEVAESRKRTAAAAALGVDQATVSRQVQSLEAWLGGRLLLDSGVPANLLPDGAKFLPVAQEVPRLLREAQKPHPLSAPPPEPAMSARDIKVPKIER